MADWLDDHSGWHQYSIRFPDGKVFSEAQIESISATKDLRGPAVVVRGSVLSGFKFYGPFDTIDAACEWCEKKTLAGVVGINNDTIVLLEEPRSDDVLV